MQHARTRHGSGALSDRARRAARLTLAGRRRGPRGLLPFMGPAFIAAVAYVDPGNFATNIQGGAAFGNRLLWVVLFACLAAMLFQALSAKLGIATGRSLAEHCRDRLPRPVVFGMWAACEIAAMATDLAEFLGVMIGLNLLFGLPLVLGCLVTGAATWGMLLLERRGFRPMEALIAALLGVLAACYVVELALARPDWGAVAHGAFVPWIGNGDALLLAVGVIGATVMPHAILLHSNLTQRRVVPRGPAEAARIVRYSNIEVAVALSLAALVNMAMMVMAAGVFHASGHAEVASIETAYHTLVPLLGAGAAYVFLVSLMASGLSSSVVGTMAGQVIMQGFVGFRIPLSVRRLVTMLPTLAVALAGVDPTRALVVSQVVLSLVLPVPLIALLVFTGRRDVMGRLANGRVTSVAAWAAGTLILALNVLLLLQQAGVNLWFLPG